MDFLKELERKFGKNTDIATSLGIPYRTWMDWRKRLELSDDGTESRKKSQLLIIKSHIELKLKQSDKKRKAS